MKKIKLIKEGLSIALLLITISITGTTEGFGAKKDNMVKNKSDKKENGVQHSLKQQKQAGTIVCLGDSLTAGFHLPSSESFPALLQTMLNNNGYHYDVINAGISGETSSETLTRLNSILSLKPDIVIFEIGANDGIRGLDIDTAKRSIATIIERLQKEGIIVIFTGMRLIWSLGKDYGAAFDQLYPELAQQYHLIFMPFFLEGVAMRKELNLPDMIHPNSAGYKIIANNIYPYVEKAIRKHIKK